MPNWTESIIATPDSGWSLSLAISLGTINAIVVIGNIFVLYILISQKSLHTSTNFIVLSLTLADFLLGIIILPFSMLQEYYSEWIFNDLWCNVWLALDVLFSTASIYNLLAISFDRYMAVKQPIKYKYISSNRMTKITISVVWIISASLAFPLLIHEKNEAAQDMVSMSMTMTSAALEFQRPFKDETQVVKICTPMTSNNVYILFSAVVSFILPTIFMVLLNISIFQTVQSSRRPKLLPLPLSSQSSNATLKAAQNPYTTLRVHRGGANRSNNNLSFGQRSMRDKNGNADNKKSASIRGNMCRSPSVCTSSFRQKPADLCKNNSSLLTMASNMQRKKSSSTSTINIVPEMDSVAPTHCFSRDNEAVNWVSQIPPSKLYSNAPLIVQNHKIEAIKLMRENDKSFDTDFLDLQEEEESIVEKTAQSTIWYPTVLTSFLVGKKAKRYRFSDRLTNLTGNCPQDTKHSMRTELRVARTICIVVGCFTVCWLPFTVIYVLQAFRTCPINECVPGWLFTTAFWLGYANSAVNPLLYAAVSRDFRLAFRKFLTGKNTGILGRFSSNH